MTLLEELMQHLATVPSHVRQRHQCRLLKRAAEHIAAVSKAIEDGGYDLSPCMSCGCPVVCIPDGLPMCGECAAKNGV